ncbi:MAG: putative Ig domain-containing protein [Reichenbachiella sp.]|uniref:putative Ig domain-containing protein n=1 Tax=Reichenbachiella sp. TaxID=2184521 RepID=UPI0032991F0A
MRKNNFYHWIKLQRRYRHAQVRLLNKYDSRLERKIAIIARRLMGLNRKWKLGVTASALSAWLAMAPTTGIQAQNTFPGTLELSTLNGTTGFTLNGVGANTLSGKSVSDAGDVNGDGINDLIIGAPNVYYNTGNSFVVFGTSSGFNPSLDLSALDGSNGFKINGAGKYNESGTSVSKAGDINGDGIDDLIIGAPAVYYSLGNSYVLFGSDTGFAAQVNLSTLDAGDGSTGFMINGTARYNKTGTSVSQAGDINGDGIDDLIVGAPNVYYSLGNCYVVFGSDTGFSSRVELNALDGSNGFMLNGTARYNQTGMSVSHAGDINNDGFDDLVIGAPNVYYSTGNSYVVFGTDTGFSARVELNALDGTNGFTVKGAARYDKFGTSVSHAGDVNGDGIDDLVFGAPKADNDGAYDAGVSYVLFGSNNAFGATIELSGLDGTNGFSIKGIGANDEFGSAVSSAGDINQDGADDLIIGAPKVDGTTDSDVGTSYVIFGSSNAFGAAIDLTGLDGTNGFAIKGNEVDDLLGTAVSNLGDINGDGVDDVVIGATGANTNVGAGYVLFGIIKPTAPTVANTIPDQVTDEDAVFNFIVAANTFDDINPNDVHTLSAALSGNGELPAWLTFDDQTNTFSGTPANGDVGILSITVTATDVDGLTTEDTFDLTINNTNDAPVLAAIGNQAIDKNKELTFIVAATDEDIPAQTLAFSLDVTSSGKGMTLDAASGAFSWTPGTELAATTHDVTVKVSDGVTEDTEVITITVNDNNTPVLAAIGDQSTDEGVQLVFTAIASDTDIPAQTLTFSLDESSTAKGMVMDAATGAFSWTPSESQDGTHTITVTVSDGQSSISEMVTITVNEVNTAPVLTALGNKNTEEGATLVFNAIAMDEDLPAQTLTFSLDETSIGKGMTIDGITGAFSWTPSNSDNGTHDVTVSVSDGSSSDSETIEVASIPVLSVAGEIDGGIQIYPNPAMEQIKLALENNHVGSVRIQIIDLSGQVLLGKEIEKKKAKMNASMDVAKLSAGIYIMEIQMSGRQTISHRLSKL